MNLSPLSDDSAANDEDQADDLPVTAGDPKQEAFGRFNRTVEGAVQEAKALTPPGGPMPSHADLERIVNDHSQRNADAGESPPADAGEPPPPLDEDATPVAGAAAPPGTTAEASEEQGAAADQPRALPHGSGGESGGTVGQNIGSAEVAHAPHAAEVGPSPSQTTSNKAPRDPPEQVRAAPVPASRPLANRNLTPHDQAGRAPLRSVPQTASAQPTPAFKQSGAQGAPVSLNRHAQAAKPAGQGQPRDAGADRLALVKEALLNAIDPLGLRRFIGPASKLFPPLQLPPAAPPAARGGGDAHGQPSESTGQPSPAWAPQQTLQRSAGGPGAPGRLRTSAEAEALVKHFEKGPDHKDFAAHQYRSPEGGTDTIGWGHKLKPGESYPNGINRAQAEALLQSDLRKAENIVRANIHVPVSQGQFDALVSLAFNVPAAFVGDTTIKRRLNKGDYAGAAQQFAVWNKGHKIDKTTKKKVYFVYPGLIPRRQAERDAFERGAYISE